jgi:hypothetical protein
MNRILPSDLYGEAKQLTEGEFAFWEKNNILQQVWRDKREVRMLSTIHSAKAIGSDMDQKVGKGKI